MQPRVLQSHVRACLDATRDADELLHDALGAKKLKELRRQRNRLAEHGAVRFEVARTPAEVAPALETFLALEASGWKAKRGTALSQDAGDAAFVRRATPALAENGQCEIVTLRAGDTPVASAIVLRHQDRAFYFKLGVDERFAKFSPGVQLTLDLTAASLRRSGNRAGGFHRRRRPSHDQPDLARAACDRRCVDPAAPPRSRGFADRGRAGLAQGAPRTRAPRRSFHPQSVRRNPHEYR